VLHAPALFSWSHAFALFHIGPDLKKKSKPIPTNDLWIPALCRQHSLPVLSLRSLILEGLPVCMHAKVSADLNGWGPWHTLPRRSDRVETDDESALNYSELEAGSRNLTPPTRNAIRDQVARRHITALSKPTV
jgi:hypothetical protein